MKIIIEIETKDQSNRIKIIQELKLFLNNSVDIISIINTDKGVEIRCEE